MHRTRTDRYRMRDARAHGDIEHDWPKHRKPRRPGHYSHDDTMPDARVDWRALLDDDREPAGY